MTPAEQLRAAKALIDAPEKWTQRVFARNASANRVAWSSKAATCYCARGALWIGAQTIHARAAEVYLNRAVPARFETGNHDLRFVKFNDDPDTTHADIMKLFDDAITLAESDQ